MLKNEAYIIDSYRVTEAQFEFVYKLTAGLNLVTRQLFCHVLASTLLRFVGQGEADDAWIPVSSILIKGKLRGASWSALEKRGLIEVKDYSRAESRSREFQIAKSVIDAFIDFTRGLPAEQVISLPCVNLFTRRSMRKPDGNVLRDDGGNNLPVLFIDAVEAIRNNGTMFYIKRVESHMKALEAESDKAERELMELKDEADKITIDAKREAYEKARGRFLNDHLCFQFVLQQRPQQIDDDLWIYPPAYKATMSGRAAHIRGGFQSCSKAMKAAAFHGTPELSNHDLEASQVNGLIQQFEIANRDPSWLVEYRDTPNSKGIYAERAFMSVECWKKCLLALCMGGTLPRRLHNLDTRRNSIIDYIRNECGDDVAKTLFTLEKFRTVVSPLADELARWHDWLVSDYYYSIRKAGRGGWFIGNKVGMKLNMTALLENYPIWEIKAKVAAFVLQGEEAAFIHTLTVLGAKYGFKAIANEHDGLIAIGKIPDEAVQEAARLSGLQNARLIEKPFVTRGAATLA